MKPDYSMTVEEVFLAAVSWYDPLWEEQGLRPGLSALTEAVADLACTLGLNILEPPFGSWLRETIHKRSGADVGIVHLRSGG